MLRELADRATVTAVAEQLHCTPSAVSQQLKALQREVGVPLTEPVGRGLRLTDAGRALVTRADDVIAAIDRAEAELDAYRRAPRGRVRLAIFPSGGELLLPGVLRRVNAMDGLGLDVHAVVMPPERVPALVADHDVVVAHRDEQAPPFDGPRLEVVTLLREPLDVALPPGHRLGRRRTVQLADLADEDWISADAGLPVDDVLASLAARTGVRPRVVQRISDSGSPRCWSPRGTGWRCYPGTRWTTGAGGGCGAGRWPGSGRPGWSKRWCVPVPPAGPRSPRCWTPCAPRPPPSPARRAREWLGQPELS